MTLLLVLQVAQPAFCVPNVAFPFNSQLPAAARIGQFYSYSFSPYTFTSGAKITYSLGDHPSWLSIESSARRLYGTPKDSDVAPGDVVGQAVTVIATDDTGASNMNATIVVSRNPAPTVQVPVSEQIQGFGKYSAPSSILSYPSTAFSYSFDPNTFQHSGQLSYYAICANSSPLPAWIHFNPATLTFTGETPPFESLIQPPQTFGFQLVASDIVGFSAASVSFSIVVGSHKLTTDKPTVEINSTRGTAFNYNGLQNSVKVDGNLVKPGDLAVTTENLPSWLNFDPNTLEISGTPGKTAHSSNFTIQFHDDFADTLNVNTMVNVATGLFSSTFDDINARPGEKLNINLATHFRNPTDVELSETTQPQSNWLQLSGLTLSGTVPESASGSLSISLRAQSKSSGVSDTEKLEIKFIDIISTSTSSRPHSTSSTSPTSSTSSTATATPSGKVDTQVHSGNSSNSHSGLSTGMILLATIIPILVIALAIVLLVCLLRRKREGRSYLSIKYRGKGSRSALSTLPGNDSQPSMRHAEKAAAIAHVEKKNTFKPTMSAGNTGAASRASRRSSGTTLSRSFELLATPDLTSGFWAHGLKTQAIRNLSTAGTEEGRQSWFTVEEAMTENRSQHTKSRQSGITMPGSLHQVLPTPNYLGEPGEDSFDWTISSLDDLSSVQPTPAAAYKPPEHLMEQRSMDSVITSSSEALPSSRRDSRKFKERDAPSVVEEEAAEDVSEPQRPSQARLSSQQWAGGKEQQQPWYVSESDGGSKSLHTETSFGSTENWRVIGGPRRSGLPSGVPSGVPSMSYKDLVESAPFHPARPSTAIDPTRASVADFMSPSKWGDEGRKVKAIREEEEEEASMKRDQSGNTSKGSEGSFKVFI